jgi:hypothetical protein
MTVPDDLWTLTVEEVAEALGKSREVLRERNYDGTVHPV